MNKTKHQCNTCNTNFPTKATLTRHSAMCSFIHTSAKEHQIDNEYSKQPVPSQESMFQYILHLTNKITALEEKVAKIQETTSISRRKHLNEYIKTLAKPPKSYSDWIKSIEITDNDLTTLFDTDLETCITQKLHTYISPQNSLPIRAFTQKQHTFYIYDTEWRMMTQDEFIKFISVLSHKVLQKYTKWAKDNRNNCNDSPQMQEQLIVYLSKANGLNRTIESRTISIKKWLFTKIQMSLKNVDI